MTKRCALLSMDITDDFYVYDYMLIEPMSKYGWIAEEVSWRNESVNWDDYDVVIVRSTWDYQDAPDAFMKTMQSIDNSSAVLENSLATLEWNINKAYLKDIEEQGVRIVPTRWFETFDGGGIADVVRSWECEEFILKPLVSANADHTYRLTLASFQEQASILGKVFEQRPFMLQPFIHSIVTEGEYSLFYFAGEYSHSILKKPKQNDFRVQEEHGGELELVEPAKVLKELAQTTLKTLPDDPLYARLDFIRTEEGFAVMEVELIEPSLYFNMDDNSAQRFVDVFIRRFGEG